MSPDLHRESCIDAERFAAWVDGGLSGEESGLVESHMADCARCQAMMAAFVKTDEAIARPAATAAVLPWRRRGGLRWALPLAGAAAAAVVIALVFPRQLDAPAPPPQSARVEQQEQALVLPPPSAPVSVQPQKPAQQERTASPPAAPQPVAEEAPAMPPQALLLPEPRPQLTSTALPKDVARDTSAPVVVSEFASQLSQSMMAESVNEIAPTPGVAGAARAPGAAAGRGGEGRGRAAGIPAAASPPPLPSAPPPRPMPSRWRVFSDGRVERSTTDGATWQPVAIAPAVITSGTTPSVWVCWLVGRQGAVLVSLDGGSTFKRVDIPGAADLTGVQAVNGSRATVRAADGRTFVTVDGGASWSQTPP